jgi:hypothetical protein
MTTCALRTTSVRVGRIHVPVTGQDIQGEVEAESLAFAVFMLPRVITIFHATTKSENISLQILLILQPYSCKYNLAIWSKI